MKPTTNKAMLLSALIKELTKMKEENGEMEVFTTNLKEYCFDGIGGTSIILNASTGEKMLLLTNNDVVLKI